MLTVLLFPVRAFRVKNEENKNLIPFSQRVKNQPIQTYLPSLLYLINKVSAVSAFGAAFAAWAR